MQRIFVGALLFFALSIPITHATSLAFPDVYGDDDYAEAVSYVFDQHIIKGYADGLFRPGRTLNRAEFAKMLVLTLGKTKEVEACTNKAKNIFSDVTLSDWFAPYVCAASSLQFIEGNPDNTFNPSGKLNVAEAATMLARAFNLSLKYEKNPIWFAPAIHALSDASALPMSLETPYSLVTRAQAADMLWRLKTNQRDKISWKSTDFLASKCDFENSEPSDGIDMEEVRRTWIAWTNETRALESIPRIHENHALNWTATQWSRLSRESGAMSHKRDGQEAYYDYALITDWFKKRDVEFALVNRSTYSESIGWGYYKCSSSDCTADFLKALRSTYDMYLREKNQASRPHYGSIVRPEFTQIGVGIAVDQATKKFYVTTHYATSITSSPSPVCM
jgi:uncharacterized protein YkwD